MTNGDEIKTLFKSLLEKMDANELTDKEMQAVSHMFMTYKINTETENSEEDFTEKDLLNFVTLGWYIYNNIK